MLRTRYIKAMKANNALTENEQQSVDKGYFYALGVLSLTGYVVSSEKVTDSDGEFDAPVLFCKKQQARDALLKLRKTDKERERACDLIRIHWDHQNDISVLRHLDSGVDDYVQLSTLTSFIDNNL